MLSVKDAFFPLRIKDLPSDEQPREKLIRLGATHLSDAEMIAVILGSGIKGVSALQVARQLMHTYSNDLNDLARLSVADLQRQKGIGRVGALRIVAAFELGRRRTASDMRRKPILSDSERCHQFLHPILSDLDHEEMHVLCLNRANALLGHHLISRGGTTGTVADAKKIFRAALTHGSVTSLILAHNHPSGQCFPSVADINLTHKMQKAAKHLDLQLLDHLIIAGESYYSFADEGRMSQNH